MCTFSSGTLPRICSNAGSEIGLDRPIEQGVAFLRPAHARTIRLDVRVESSVEITETEMGSHLPEDPEGKADGTPGFCPLQDIKFETL